MKVHTRETEVLGSPREFLPKQDYWGVHPEIFFDLPSVLSLIIDVSTRRDTVLVQI